jgi:hypothetical protein
MALNSLVTSVACPAAGDSTISLSANFDPKAVIAWTVGRTADGGGSAHMRFSYGFATYRGAVVQQAHLLIASEDAAGTSDCYCGHGTASLVKLTDGLAATVALECDLLSMQSGATSQVVLAWPTRLSGAIVNLVILGGSDLEDALVSSFTNQTTPATQDVTVASGFGQPNLLLFLLSWIGTEAIAAADSDISLGFGVKQATANGRGFRVWDDDAATTQATSQRINNNAALQAGTGASDGDSIAQLSADSAWPTDGFQLTYTTQVTGGESVPYLALKVSANVTVNHGQGAMPTTISNQTLTSADTPKLAVVFHTRQTSAGTNDVSSADCMMFGVGAVDGDTNERCAGGYDDDGQATAAVAGTHQSATKTLQTWVPPTDALDGEADGVVSGSNFELQFTDAPPSAFLYQWFTLGAAAPPAAQEIPDVVMAAA